MDVGRGIMHSAEYLLVSIIILFSLSCSEKGAGILPYSSWKSRDSAVYRTEIPEPGELPKEGAFLWGGTVSHHLLAFSYIDRWFLELKSRRNPEIFFILSPAHFNTQTQKVSLTTDPWTDGERLVRVNRKIPGRLMKLLGVEEDPEAFNEEHGVSVFIPFIRQYFPEAEIVPLIYSGEPPLDVRFMDKLYKALSDEYLKVFNKSFLLVSSDFSHHGDAAVTAERDRKSGQFFDNPDGAGWLFAGCDNRPGMYVLSQLFSLIKNSSVSVLWNTNSAEILDEHIDDITSYFFSFFWSE